MNVHWFSVTRIHNIPFAIAHSNALYLRFIQRAITTNVVNCFQK